MKCLISLMVIIALTGCIQSNDYSDIPHLEFQGFSKTTMIQGSNQQDSTIMNLFFTDGDGDFGSQSNSYEANIFIKDL
ncbi:MAG TPA: hypothetical protein PK611_12245, partial [Saprospiraceae bacterium]|nr:hypothetical protein [Saprospiraceae bacterium]